MGIMFLQLALVACVSSASALAFGAPAPSRARSVTMGLQGGDKMPMNVLSKAGVRDKKAVLFWYGADDAPSCSKELSSFEESLSAFTSAGVSVVGLRNPAGDKGYSGSVKVIADEGDELRNAVGIDKDFGLLGGRETYVVDASGTIVGAHRNQFDPKSHITKSLEAVETLPKSPFDSFDIRQVAGVLGINLYSQK